MLCLVLLLFVVLTTDLSLVRGQVSDDDQVEGLLMIVPHRSHVLRVNWGNASLVVM